MNHDVFISYSHKTNLADAVCHIGAKQYSLLVYPRDGSRARMGGVHHQAIEGCAYSFARITQTSRTGVA